jgi:hypothetical protein
MRSLQRALHKDEAGRRISDPFAGPLFFDAHMEDDQAADTIYVLRSKSEHPVIVANRDLVQDLDFRSCTRHKSTNNKHFSQWLFSHPLMVNFRYPDRGLPLRAIES